MCLQYWRARKVPERRRLLTVRGGYHGDTFGAMAVCDPVAGMHAVFADTLAQHVFADRPPAGFGRPIDPGYEAHLTELFERHAHELAAVIIEPIVQGAGGMHFYSPEILARVRGLCDEHDLLLIAQMRSRPASVARAHGWRASTPISPRTCCALARRSAAAISRSPRPSARRGSQHAISTGEEAALMHGPTFMANPLACSVALASLDLLADIEWPQDVAHRARARRRACRRSSDPRSSRCAGARRHRRRATGAMGKRRTRHARRGRARRVAAPLPRPRVHDAAIHHRRRRPWTDRVSRHRRRRSGGRLRLKSSTGLTLRHQATAVRALDRDSYGADS